MGGYLTCVLPQVDEQREKKLEEAKKAHEKLIQNATSLADALDKDLPELQEKEEEQNEMQGISLYEGEVRAEGDLEGPFDDEDTREFYMTLPELQAMVPPSLLGLEPKASDAEPTADGTQSAPEEGECELNSAKEADTEATTAEETVDEQETGGEAVVPGAEATDEDLKPHHQVELLLGTRRSEAARVVHDAVQLDACERRLQRLADRVAGDIDALHEDDISCHLAELIDAAG